MSFIGKDRKFRQAYNDYYPLVYSIVYRRIHSIQDTEDICHNIFCTFYEKMEEVIDHKKWLTGAARYSIMNFYDSTKKKKHDISIDDPVNPEIYFVNGEKETRMILNEAIENNDNFKNEKEKVLFELIAVNNFSYKNVGRHLGMSKRQVEYAYYNIVKRIINYLKDKGITDIEKLL